jgi:hypothetical protein
LKHLYISLYLQFAFYTLQHSVCILIFKQMKLFFILKPCIAHIAHHILALHVTVILHAASEHAHTTSHASWDRWSIIIYVRNSPRTGKNFRGKIIIYNYISYSFALISESASWTHL